MFPVKVSQKNFFLSLTFFFFFLLADPFCIKKICIFYVKIISFFILGQRIYIACLIKTWLQYCLVQKEKDEHRTNLYTCTWRPFSEHIPLSRTETPHSACTASTDFVVGGIFSFILAAVKTFPEPSYLRGVRWLAFLNEAVKVKPICTRQPPTTVNQTPSRLVQIQPPDCSEKLVSAS